MQKDFDTWNEEKKIINIRQDTTSLFFEERDIGGVDVASMSVMNRMARA